MTKFSKAKIIFAIIIIFGLFGRAGSSEAADWYVRSGAGGNGTSWTSAWSNITNIAWNSIQPGDTIWIAGGSYGNLTPDKSGNADTNAGRIFIKRATASAHGSDTGWSVGYDSEVSLSSISWGTLNLGSYVTIDGQVDSGIRIPHSDGDNSSISFDRGVNYVTLRNLDIAGPGDVNGFHHSGDDRGIDITAWNNISYDVVDNLKVQFSRIHGACTQLWIMNTDNSVWEYNKIYNSTDSSGDPCHPNIIATSDSSNVTFRYNEIYNYDAEGIMMINGNSGTWYIFGNLWHTGQTYARVLETQGGTNGPVYFYNNTADGLWASVNVADGGAWAAGSQGRNNIWWNMSWAEGLPSEGNNFCSDTCGSAGDISNGSNPFVNSTSNDYHLVSTVGAKYPKDKGINLESPYNSDMDGNIRGGDGIWDIGAYEYVSGGDVTPPAAPQGLIVN